MAMTTATSMDRSTAMTTDALTLVQWLSPAFPVGAFAYSHGLEAAVAEGWVATPEDLEAWLSDVMHFGAGRVDSTLIAAAWRAAPAEIAGIDALARALAPSSERLLETTAQGAAFGRVLAEVWGLAVTGLTLPVALGRAAGLQGLDLTLTQTLYLQGVAGNLVAAGQRLMALGQTDGQAILKRLAPLCSTVAQDTGQGDLDGLSSSAFLSDIAAMRHETVEPRIFRT